MPGCGCSIARSWSERGCVRDRFPCARDAVQKVGKRRPSNPRRISKKAVPCRKRVRTNSLRGAVFSKNRLATLWDARDSEHSQQL
jgi:hypothetical protein